MLLFVPVRTRPSQPISLTLVCAQFYAPYLPSCHFPSGLAIKILHAVLFLPNLATRLRLFHPPRYDHRHKTFWAVQIMKVLIMQLPSSSSNLADTHLFRLHLFANTRKLCCSLNAKDKFYFHIKQEARSYFCRVTHIIKWTLKIYTSYMLPTAWIFNVGWHDYGYV